MGFFDSDHVKHIGPNILVGFAAAIIRAITSKEGWKPFTARVIIGSLMAGVLAWIIKDAGLPPAIEGLICFAGGYSAQEMAIKLSKMGLKAVDELDKTDKEEENDSSVSH